MQIEKPVYGGAFLARVEGKAVFVPLTLPGEQARVRIAEDKRGYATAEVEEVVSAAPQRVTPACRHFGVCGGCHYQHADYVAQLAFKQAILRETLERAGVAVPEKIAVLSGEPLAYRNRIRLAFDAAGNPGYRGRRSHSVIPVSECPIAAPLLTEAAQAAAQVARQMKPAFRPTEIAFFCNADETAMLASVFTASAKKIRFDEFAKALAERVPALQSAELVLEGRKSEQPRTVAHWGADSLLYRAAGFDYRVDRGAFFQVNRWLVDALVERVTAGRKGRAGLGFVCRRGTVCAATHGQLCARDCGRVRPSATQALAANLKHTCGIPVRATTLDFLRNSGKSQRPDLIVRGPTTHRPGRGIVHPACGDCCAVAGLRLLRPGNAGSRPARARWLGIRDRVHRLGRPVSPNFPPGDSSRVEARLIGLSPKETFQPLGAMQAEDSSFGQASDGSASPGLGAVPLFHAAWLFAAGIALTPWLWLRPSSLLVALALVALLCGVAALRAQRIAWLPLAVLWLLLGAWCAEMEPHPAPAPAIAALSDGLLRTVEGTVVKAGPVHGEMEQVVAEHDGQESAPPATNPTQQIDLRVSSLEVVDDTQDVQFPVSSFWRRAAHDSLAPRAGQPLSLWRARARRGPAVATGSLSRSGSLEPRGFSPRPGHYLYCYSHHRSGGASGRRSRSLPAVPRCRIATCLKRAPAGLARGHAAAA